MKKQKSILVSSFIIMGIVLMLTYSCKKDNKNDSTPATSNGSLIGTWNGGGGSNNFTLIFNSNMKYSIEAAGYTVENGTFTNVSPSFTLQPTGTIICASQTSTIKYNYTATATTLTCTKVNDSCAYRSGVIASTFSKP